MEREEIVERLRRALRAEFYPSELDELFENTDEELGKMLAEAIDGAQPMTLSMRSLISEKFGAMAEEKFIAEKCEECLKNPIDTELQLCKSCKEVYTFFTMSKEEVK